VGVCGLAIANARTHARLETALSDLGREYDRSARLAGELQDLNDHLEERIRRRTEELEAAALDLEKEVRQRKEAEENVRSRLEEKTLLLRELDHRVKNNFQLIISILSTEARKAGDPLLQQALAESRNRIRTMAAVHDKIVAAGDLYRIDLAGYARHIATSLLSLYKVAPGRIRIVRDIPEIVLDINTAIPVGLSLNELISNAIRHGFPEGKTGEIALTVREEGPFLTIVCRDDGPGLPRGYDWKNPDTVGLAIVASLVGQLEGSIEREPSAGTTFVIRVKKAAEDSGPKGTFNRVLE
jgi:two-component sensor histidine kinase